MKTRTRKKTPLLDEGLGERLSMTEWRKHYVSSVTAEEEAWPQREPGSNLGRIFVLLLLLHVFIIGAVVLYNIVSPKVPLSVRTDSKPALTGTMSAASMVSTGTGSAPAPASTAPVTPPKTVNNNTATKPAAATPTPEPVKSKPVPVVAPKPADNSDNILTYEVKSGDNVPGIASTLGISAEDLVKMNNLANTDLYPGRKLEYRKPSSGSSSTPTPPALKSPAPALASNRNILINPAPVTPSASNSKPKPDTLKADRPNPDAIPTAAKIEVSASDADSVPHAVPIKSTSHVEDQLPAAKPKVKNNNIEDSPPAARSKSDSKSKSETKHKSDDAKPKKSSKTDKDRDRDRDESSPKTKSKSDKSSKDGSHKRTHIVGPHETLYSISHKFGVSVGALERANNIKDPTHIRDGSKITIPSKANAD